MFMIRRYLIGISLTLSLLLIATIAVAFLNGTTCRYSLDIEDNGRNTFLTCFRGKIVALHSQHDEEGKLLSKWKVEARQFRLGQQQIFFVYSRKAVFDDMKEDPNDHFNRISSGYRFLFYKFIRDGDDVYILENFPNFEVHKGTLKGKLDLWDDEF